MFATAYLNNALLCHGLDWIALAFTGELGSGGCILHMHVQLHVQSTCNFLSNGLNESSRYVLLYKGLSNNKGVLSPGGLKSTVCFDTCLHAAC